MKKYMYGAVILLCSSISTLAMADCMPIAEACMKAGYYKGGDTKGKGLIKDCVEPIANNQKTLPDATFTSEALEQCKQEMAEKMKSQN
jgi:hypothetical protein